MVAKPKQLRFPCATAALRASESVIGRSLYCTIVLSDQSVSRTHASIFDKNGNTYVQDLGSKNGTTVNGQPVGNDPCLVAVGDVLTFGKTECVLERRDAAHSGTSSTLRPPSTSRADALDETLSDQHCPGKDE